MRKLCMFAAAAAAGLLLGACALFGPGELADTYTVHKVYGDHMVLQRERPVKISGTATPGKSVKVTIADKTAFGTADQNGEWVAEFPAMKAGGPFEVTVSAAEGTPVTKFEDVLVGEVWLCSGQSNMEMPVFSSGPFWRAANAEAEVAMADHPQIRFFNTAARRSLAPRGPVAEIAGPGWEVCSPTTVGPFSAMGYFFGRQLNKDLNVPVGLINSSWGGTPIQSWISGEGYRRAGRTLEQMQIDSANKSQAQINETLKAAKAKSEKEFASWMTRFFSSAPETSKAAQAWMNPDFDDSAWKNTTVPCDIESATGNEELDGAVWFRRTVDIPAAWAGKELKLSLGVIDDCDETYFNGKKVGATGLETAHYWSARRLYTIPADLVKAGKNTIAVRVIDMYASGGFMSPALELFLAPAADEKEKIELAGEWKSKLEFKADLKKIGNRPNPPELTVGDVGGPSFPATLYNSMIHPWTVYPIRGAIWYQGEANAGAYQDYMTLHQLLINDWRRIWNDPKMPFIFVQLAAFERHSPKDRLADDFWTKRDPSDGAWPKLREVQTATLNMPDTGMVVAIDIGDAFDIHPRDKQTLGYRAAKEAQRIAFGSKAISAGPLYESMKIEGNTVRLAFRNVGQGLVAKNGPLATFAIAGEDGKFVWADARIDGDTVVVSSDLVKAPKMVRYAWSSFPGNPNLFNKDGFPASPFRTDMPDYLLK